MSEKSGGQEQARRNREEVAEEVGTAAVNSEVAERKESLDADVDDILDEIDDVLESNAEDFVKSFIQKGGQ
jgi:ubiquitin-like protein Pup